MLLTAGGETLLNKYVQAYLSPGDHILSKVSNPKLHRHYVLAGHRGVLLIRSSSGRLKLRDNDI